MNRLVFALLVFLSICTSISAQTPSVPGLVRSLGTDGSSFESVFVGESLRLSVDILGSSPVTVRWFHNSRLIRQTENVTNTSSFDIAPASSTNAGVYWAEVANSAGTVQSKWTAVTVLIPKPPVLLRGLAGGPLFSRNTLSWAADGPISDIEWLRNGTPIPGAIRSTLSPATIGPGDYAVRLSNSAGAITSPTVKVQDIPYPFPMLAKHPLGAIARAGEPWSTAALNYSATYLYAGETIEWSKDGGPFSTTFPINQGAALLSDAGEYRLRITRDGRSFTSDPARLVVQSERSTVPPIIKMHPASLTVRAGGPRGYFTVALEESAVPSTYQWRKDGSPLAGATSATYTLPATDTLESHVGSYDVVVTSSGGSTTSRPATFEIAGSAPGADAIFQHPSSSRVTLGRNVTLAVRIGSNAFAKSSSSAAWPRMTWRQNGAVKPSARDIITSYSGDIASLSFNDVKAEDYGTYTVTLELENGTTVTSRPAVLEDSEASQLPRFALSPSSSNVEMSSTTSFGAIVYGENPIVYQWLKDGTVISGATSTELRLENVSSSSAGRYVLRATNRLGSTDSQPVTLTVEPAITPIIDRQPNSYILLTGDSFPDELTVLTRPDYSIQWLKDGQPLSGQTTYAVNFTSIPNPAGRYRAVITNRSGQSVTSDESIVAVEEPPAPPYHAIAPSGPVTLTGGDSLVLASIPTTREVRRAPVTGFPRFQWLRNGTPIPSATKQTYVVLRSSEGDAGEYTVSRDDGTGPWVSAPVQVRVSGSAPAVSSIPFIQSISTPQSETITLIQPLRLGVSLISSSPVTYEWYRDGIRLSQFAGPALSIAQTRRTDAGTYTLIARNATGAVHALSWRVQVSIANVPPILVEGLPPKIELIPGQSVTLAPSVESVEPPTYRWTRNGQSLAGVTSTVGLSTTGSYGAGTYALTVSNRHGSTVVGTSEVKLAPPESGGIYAGTSDLFFSRNNQSQAGLLAYIDDQNIGHILSLGSLGGWAENLPFTAGQARTPFPSLPGNSTGTSRQDYTFSTEGDRLTMRLSSATTGGSTYTRAVRGATLAHSGYYQGTVEGTSSNDVRAIVTPDGIVGVGVFHEGRFHTGYARFSPGAAITVTQLGLNTPATPLNFTVNAAGPQIIGSIVTASGVQKTFSATRLYGPPGSRLSNVSSRGFVGSSDRAMIAGFSLAGAGERRVLIRGIGPTLASFGVSAAVPDTALTLFQGSNRLAQNDNWSNGTDSADIASAATASGAFALVNGSRDAALLRALGQGSYTAQVSETANREGIALAELYVLGDQADGPAVSNLSIRGHAASGEDALIAGLAVNGAIPRRLLIRAVGPTLSSFNVTGAMADPRLRIFHGDALVAQNDNWAGGSALATAASTVGAFALPASSRDAALIIDLPPGTYTAQVDGGPSGDTGIVLLEAYVLP